MVQVSAGAADSGDPPRSGRVRYIRDDIVPSAQRMVLGRALSARRTFLGLKQGEVARLLGASVSKVSRIESGQHQFKAQDLARLFTIYRIVDPAEQAELRQLAEEANRQPWWQPWSAVAQKHLQAVVSFEDIAQRIRVYEPLHLPGLLQTESYARAVIANGTTQPSHQQALIDLRMERQRRFETADENKKLICVLDEGALRRRYGTPQIMHRQLEHLIERAASPRYVIRLAELDRYNLPVYIGSTTIWEFAARILPDIAYSENFDGGLIIQDEEQTDARKKVFDRLRQASLSPQRSVQRLKDLASSRYYR
ncbi:helix-turn-helix transcriptional regulator [Streptomyces sp. MA15]|uniref:helix-turn-helix domain-containing protein n=1 Tax=Streptomyces sp. MA15 TaxID=3055061 RepID=UPI0025B082D1|nr:helix-turn-helix transcriptional regulator [Streptomyces sp. MA15]MDN3267043.1 helix-turn-helix transcriptional regulator [Streptomyces sp. MA15]